jgi:hypothetical protein
VKGAGSKAYALLRRCGWCNDEVLPDIEDTPEKWEPDFVRALSNYKIVLCYTPNGDGKIVLELKRKCGSDYEKYFNDGNKAKKFDELMQHYLGYLFKVLMHEENAGGIERSLWLALTISIFSYCQNERDLIVYYFLRDKMPITDVFDIDKLYSKTDKRVIIDDYEGDGKDAVYQMPRKLYLYNLFDRCACGKEGQPLDRIEERNFIFSGDPGRERVDRLADLKKLRDASDGLGFLPDSSWQKNIELALEKKGG